MSTVVFLHAHPDDEVTTTGGTMARLAAEGHRVVLLTATRGELGEVPDGLLLAGETLADRRVNELAASCRALGVARQEFLGFHDSGMAGEPSNDREGAFALADVDEAAVMVADILRDERADVLVAYDEHGGYGHPDHIMVHRVGLRAAELAETPRVFMATMDRGFFRTLLPVAEAAGMPVTPETIALFDTIGVPSERVTTEIDVSKHLGAKRSAMKMHESQIGDTGFFLGLSDETFAEIWGHEWYVRVRPEISETDDAGGRALVRESSLVR